MILELHVSNLAIIEGAQLELGPGFTVLTGETGAGKSLLVDAINLALGERADADLVRRGASRATVAAVVRVEADLAAACEEAGFPAEDGRLYLQREVLAEGRSQVRINGRLAPVGTLRSLGKLLVDLHGQHDHQALLDPLTHVRYLDEWIGPEAVALREEVVERYRAFAEAKAQLEAVRRGQREREQRLDLLRFQVREIEEADPRSGEFDQLESDLARLRNLERLQQAASHALDSLSEAEVNAYDLVADSHRQLADVLRFDPDLGEAADLLQEAQVRLQEAARALRGYLEDLESDPGALEAVAARLDLLKRLRRKYGEDEDAILAFLHEARQELERLEGGGRSEEELEAQMTSAQAALEESAARLSELRREAAPRFSAEVAAHLTDLDLPRAVLEVRIEPKPIDAEGGDAVQFLVSANLGEPPKPLAKIASGGEVSRVMLALKTALAGKAGVPTLIFDEVDSGLSGRAAAKVAAKMRELAAQYQILAITHLPQIASRAHVHFRIEKRERGGRVETVVRKLEGEERVEEVARLVAGEKLTEAALANARQLLADGQETS
jgi:DNA repair protein RecN (Recombination protein N)